MCIVLVVSSASVGDFDSETIESCEEVILVNPQAPSFQGIPSADLHARLFSLVGNASELVCYLFEGFFHFCPFRRVISISLA